jgi:nitroreductase
VSTIPAESTNSGLQAILNRRSPASFSAVQPPKELIERLIEAGIRAPNHYLNEPWRFIVLAGDARKALGEAFAESLRGRLPDAETPQAQAQLQRERQKTLRSPVLIAIASARTENTRALPIEDVEAVAAAVENMLLVAPELGLGAFWRTGDAAYDDRVKAHLGLKPEDQIVAFLYVGYPATWGDLTPRTGTDDKTRWLGWEH